MHAFTWVILFLSALFWIFRLIRFFYHAVQYYDIKKFFNAALKIDDVCIRLYLRTMMPKMHSNFRSFSLHCALGQNELDNYTWHEIQKRIREVQAEQQMCIHKEHLTELDIYHRILRYI